MSYFEKCVFCSWFLSLCFFSHACVFSSCLSFYSTITRPDRVWEILIEVLKIWMKFQIDVTDGASAVHITHFISYEKTTLILVVCLFPCPTAHFHPSLFNCLKPLLDTRRLKTCSCTMLYVNDLTLTVFKFNMLNKKCCQL